MIGKRSHYLPVKMKVSYPEWDEYEENIIGYETYTVNIEYVMDGEYISKFTMKDAESKEEDELFYTIEYEE